MKKTKVLLSYVRSDKHDDRMWDYTGLFYLAGALERAGYEPLVYHKDWQGLVKAVDTNLPDVVGFSCDAENQRFLERLIPSVRRDYEDRTGKKLVVLVGGPQAVSLGEAFLITSGADHIIRGEGDETLPALLDILFAEGSKGRDDEKLNSVPGLAWIDGKGAFRETEGIGIVEDLDTLPRPAYHASLHRRVYGRVVFSGRGCPFSCAFCASNVGHQRLRQRKIEDVISEISDNLSREPGLRYIIIQDDTFCTDPKRVRLFCEGMRNIRKKHSVVWFCETHVKTLLKDPELLREMIASGLVRLQIGMESGDAKVLRMYNKNITPQDMIDLVEMAVDMGLPQIAGNFITGGPKEEDGVTEAFIRRLIRVGAGVVDINTGFLRNYPQTAISKDPAAFGLKVVSEDNLTAGDDYPSVIPVDSAEDDIIALRQSYNRAIREEMGMCIQNRQIPLERVLKQFKLREEYGISSRWTLELSAREYINEYYRMFYLGEAVPFDRKIPACELYPQRTFQFYRSVISTDGITKLFGSVLSPLEYDIIFHSAGKMSISKIADVLWNKQYKEAYPDKGDFEDAVTGLIESFERSFLVTVFRFPPVQGEVV